MVSQLGDIGPHELGYVDTFDFRLFARGLTLEWERIGPQSTIALRLTRIRDGDVLQRTVCPSFANEVLDLPKSMAANIEAIIKPRKLLLACSWTEKQWEGALPNLGRVVITSAFGLHLLWSSRKSHAKLGLSPMSHEHAVSLRFKRAGVDPRAYSSKIKVPLKADQTCMQAAVLIFRQLTDVLRANIDGVVCDVDSEFLHDFRVSIRRIRSALRAFKGVLSTEAQHKWRMEFAWLGTITGPVRDLDVFLLWLSEVNIEAPFTHELKQYQKFLLMWRTQRFSEMREGLVSPRFDHLMKTWESQLENGFRGQQGKRAKDLIGKRCDIWIRKQLNSVHKLADQLRPDSPDTDFHKMRIQLKRTRYLLEFFAPLYEAGDLKKVLKAMRRLQNNLGRFNDLCVQIDTLMVFARDLHLPDMEKQQTHLAIGCLIGQLRSEKEVRRREFSEIFKAFEKQVGKADFSRALRLKEEAQS